MSPAVAGPADEARTFERKRPRSDDDSASIEGPDAVRPRPLSYPQPSRSIGVESILNPPSKAGPVAENGREASGPQLATASPSRARLPSSPTVHLPSPSLHPAKRLSSSPSMRAHQTLAPASPSARFVAAGGVYGPKVGISQSPLAHPSRLGSYSTAPGSPLPMEAASTHHHPAPISVHSTPTFHSRRTSANPTPNPSSQETSPTTPVSAYSQLGRSSPALTTAPIRRRSPPTALRHGKEQARERGIDCRGGSQAEHLPYGMIPCIIDMKSGSSSQAEKRKANSDASRRFRNRKRNELQLEQKITGQQDEIRKHTETVQRQAQEIRSLMQERDFYRAERDFFRDHVARLVPAGQLPTRPASPRALRPSFELAASERERERETAWHASEAPRKSTETTSGPSGPLIPAPSTIARSSSRPPVTWSSTPASSYAAVTPMHPDEQQARSLPQFPATWPRNS
ncbi:hypothetical protein BO70DRAFT_423207 [Aspergillus heteromorphus CBS 117.55]|uniref:BZIP domain-containing protein n=1 Tax=Aspergillus heteromorphus CBS 117.55 TaxID=1448321 RepID=A0A317WJ03_9EURO|nr:uncharacterized protein BO70DRAFT_423207 [Aspergillus heteromorphus CBS 117.55]PWY86035.1 hypothetical protein BO70DRAFT_423207 [Aspergillus heteromorphus CBS 117.55]